MSSDQFKFCRKCKEDKPVSEFFKCKRMKDGLANQCKICSLIVHKLKYATDAEYRKRRIQNTLDSKRKQWYGINKEEFNSLLKSQYYCCAICHIKLDRSRRGLVGHLDHCHTTKKIRGILCKECNMALGLFKDSETSLLYAVEYLRNSNVQ